MAPSIRSIPNDSMDQKPLAEALRATTRPIHKRLNRLIMCRMPMALPPRVNDPSIYATGLLHIAPIYMTFETLWQSILTPPGDGPDSSCQAGSQQAGNSGTLVGPVPLEDFSKPAITLKLGLVLLKLFLPGLRRTAALRQDLMWLTGWSPTELDAELRRVIASHGAVHDFTTRIRKTLEQRPHVLVSYAYIFYMALFAGGRFIRSSLESQGTTFWDRIPVSLVRSGMTASENNTFNGGVEQVFSPGKASGRAAYTPARRGTFGSRLAPPVNFLKFETPSDGVDLKEEFKGRLKDSESLLTDNEKEEIVQEATIIFEEMLSVVEQLDHLFEPDKPSDAVSVASGSSDAAQESKITDRLRDSVVVAKERREKKDAQGSGEAFSGPLPSLGEGEDEYGDAEGLSKAIRFSRDPENVAASVVASPEKADSAPVVSSLDGANDEVSEATEKQGLFKEAQEPGVDEDDEQEAQEGHRLRNTLLPGFAQAVALATFTWLVMCLTAMLLGRSEPFRRGCPEFNPYHN